MRHQFPAHCLITFPLFKGIAGTISVFKEMQCAVRKALSDKISDDVFLVFNGGVVLVQFIINGNAAVSCNTKFLYQYSSHFQKYITDNIVSYSGMNHKKGKILMYFGAKGGKPAIPYNRLSTWQRIRLRSSLTRLRGG